MSLDTSVILLAGGRGVRMNTSIPKQFLPLQDKVIALHSYEVFSSCPHVREIVVVCAPEYRSLFIEPSPLLLKFALPGKRRQDSVWNGLQQISTQTKLVCIHDSARPFLLHDDLLRVLEAGIKWGAAALGSPIKNTIKVTDQQECVEHTLPRDNLWEIYTPQVAIPSLLKSGFALAVKQNITVTDDVSLIELTGHPVKLVKGSSRNRKITTAEDLL